MYNNVKPILGAALKRVILLLFLTTVSLFSAVTQKHDKMILLYVEMDNCPWCKKMNREVFDDSSNLNELQKLYEIKKVKKGSIYIPTFITTKYYPTTYILSSDGKKVIDELPGYMKAEDYLDYLKTLDEVENP